jgi:Na+-translocating ferredoxin:NAD+ oxidoreductase RnfD subunit
MQRMIETLKSNFAWLQSRKKVSLSLQLFALHSYLYVLLFHFYEGRFLLDYIILIFSTILIEQAFYYYTFKKFTVPFSGLICSTSLFILISTHYTVWPYLVAMFVGISSKYLIRWEKGHVFNPSCFGIVVVSFLMPQLAHAKVQQWIASPTHFLLVYGLGIFIATLSRRIVVSVSYFLTILIFTFVYSKLFTQLPLITVLGPLMGLSVAIFSFHMITDPATTPSSKRGQILMGILVAVLDFSFRRLQQPQAPFLALAIVSALRPIFLTRESGLEQLETRVV